MECMQGQDIKHRYHRLISKFLCLLSCAIVCTATPSRADDIDTDITSFYQNWLTAQKSNIPAVKDWADTHLNADSEITVKVVAKIPSLIDHEFRKTLKIDARKAEKHLVQWLNIHKHNVLDVEIIESVKKDDIYKTKVSYKAHGVTVLPAGKHKTVRLKTDLDVICNDTLTEPPINVIKSKCVLNASSVPLRSLK